MEAQMILADFFHEGQNSDNGAAMSQYMKNRFPFFGIKTPERCKIMSRFFKETNLHKQPFSQELCWSLWDNEEREWQYAALDYAVRYTGKFDQNDMDFLKKLITDRSWWDTVDTIAVKLVGDIVLRYPELVSERMDSWSKSENLWLRRTAILHQLHYKTQTKENVLYGYIMDNAESKEFFIQKAIGWALREYSKTNPQSVANFLRIHKVAPLSLREGSKYITMEDR